MSQKLTPSRYLIQLLVRAQQLAQKESVDDGYAMVVVSVLSVMMFSLLAAYLMMTNISKAATNAYMESTSTFYVAESGLNQRANELRQKFLDYATPEGVSPGEVGGQIASVSNMAACVDRISSNDGTGDYSCQKLELNHNHQLASTVRQGKEGKSLSTTDANQNIGYTAYTFASDRTNYTDPIRKFPQVTTIPPGQPYAGLNAMEYIYTIYSTATSRKPEDIDARAMTVLEMTFKNRAIALFQFAVFYNEDLEMTSSSQMDITGRVHTNANLYAKPTPSTTETTRLLGSTTVAGKIYNSADAFTLNRFGTTWVLLSGNASNPDDPLNKYEPFPAYDPDRKNPLDGNEIAKFQGKVLDGARGASILKLPLVGFLRKRDRDNKITDYYGKADLRLEIVPKRTAGNVPFNFSSIQDGGTGGSCSGFELSANRQGMNLRCTKLNEGQLQSLQQPVMVKVTTNEERTSLCPTSAKNYDSTIDLEKKTLRALQVAIAAQKDPVPLSNLALTLNDPSNASLRNIAIALVPTIDTTKTPNQIADSIGACFRPAPIQVLKTSNTPNSNYNWESSYFDRREKRWIGMLQTNLASLTLWNRDGLYVNRDNNFTTNDVLTSTSPDVIAAFNNGNSSTIYDTDRLLFLRATADPTAPVGSFRKLGLSTADRTEGGLTLNATLSDDLGDGTSIAIDPADNQRIYPDGKTKGVYGFAVSGGNDLPGPFTMVTDLPIYVQGNYNTLGGDLARQPASLVGDVITVLSSNCLDPSTQLINCGITSGQNPATDTTINAAFLSNTDRSVGNIGSLYESGTPRFSGGLNNYMRMVENWQGIAINYQGSFVSMGNPQEFSGEWVIGNPDAPSYYMVPNRNFKYDSNFNAYDRLPPLTPKVLYLQQETFKRSYN